MEGYVPDEKLRQIDAVKEAFDLDRIEAMLEEKVSQIGKLIDDQFDRILSGFDKAVEKIQSLPEDTDMDQWVKDHPEYDLENIKKMNEKVLSQDWSDLDASNLLLGELSGLNGGNVDLNTAESKKMQEDFDATMKRLEDMASNLQAITADLFKDEL